VISRRAWAGLLSTALTLLVMVQPGQAVASFTTLVLSKTVGPPTTRLGAQGSGFGPSEVVDLTFDVSPLAKARTDPTGSFTRKIAVPASALPGDHTITATGEQSGLSASAGFTVRTDWPMFRFSLNRTGHNPYENVVDTSNVGSLVTKWAQNCCGEITTSPAVVGGVVYAGDGEGQFYAADADTGTILWQVTLGNQGVISPLVAGGVVYVGTATNGILDALDAGTGRVIWSKAYGGGVFDSPVLWNGMLYVWFDNGNLYALDSRTGNVLWSVPNMPNSPVALAGGVIYVGTQTFKVEALDARTGHLLWKTPVADLVDATPAVAGGVVYAATTNIGAYKVYALDASTGEILWTHNIGAVEASPAVADGVLYVGSLDGWLHAYDAASGTLIWSVKTGDAIWASPAVANGVVYVGSHDNIFYAFDAASGTKLWTYSIGGWTSSPVIADGVLYVGSWDKNLYAFALP